MQDDPRARRAQWILEEDLAFLNHGSFGACPRPVLEVQEKLRRSLERQPVEFLARRLEGLFDAARGRLAAFLGAEPTDLVAVPNATSGVNTVLRSLRFDSGDELLTTDHAYNACRNSLEWVAERAGARVVVATVPMPVISREEVVEAVLAAVTPRTRLALLDHVTSPTGLVFPIEELVRRLEDRGVDVLVDGAHAPGMLPLDLPSMGAAYYTGNCHKWLCAPKGAAFLYAREDRQEGVAPLSISHGANRPRPGRSRFHDLFDWTGTVDPTPFLTVPASLDFMAGQLPGGWPDVMEHNRNLALQGRRLLCQALDIEPPCPDGMLGSLAAIPLPPRQGDASPPAHFDDALQEVLLSQYRIEVPVYPWPAAPGRWLRISAQLYNRIEEYELLARALRKLL
ncbi:MAG: aminotransferase class V-fold PLP-dependent enzyme [Acidobacteria bacterium]|nr:aminotransferase class V-fold PLP-dependent enzyme [Acidobacteriota bacterium]